MWNLVRLSTGSTRAPPETVIQGKAQALQGTQRPTLLSRSSKGQGTKCEQAEQWMQPSL